MITIALLLLFALASVMLEEATMVGETAMNLETELYETLKEGLLNDTENLEKMREKFTFGPNERKLCIPVHYMIICTDDQEERCDNSVDCSTLNPLSINTTWLSFNSSTLAGEVLHHYARLNLEVLGLSWAGACDVSPKATLYLNINISLLCNVSLNNMRSAIKNLTKQVSLHLSGTLHVPYCYYY